MNLDRSFGGEEKRGGIRVGQASAVIFSLNIYFLFKETSALQKAKKERNFFLKNQNINVLNLTLQFHVEHLNIQEKVIVSLCCVSF